MKKFILLSLLLTGCASTGQPFNSIPPIQKKSAQLVIYRPSAFIGVAESPTVIINGIKKCAMPSSSFMISDFEPGYTRIEFNEYAGLSKSSVALKTNAGERYYIKITPNTGRALMGGSLGLVGMVTYDAIEENPGTYILSPVSQEIGQNEIKSTRQAMSCN